VTNRKILIVYNRILCEVCVGRASLYICAQQNSSGGGYTSTVHKRSTYSTYSEADSQSVFVIQHYLRSSTNNFFMNG